MLKRLRGRIENLKKRNVVRLELLQDDVNTATRKSSVNIQEDDLDSLSSVASRKDKTVSGPTFTYVSTKSKFKYLNYYKSKSKKSTKKATQSTSSASAFDNAAGSRKKMNQLKHERSLQSGTGAFLERTVYDKSVEFKWHSNSRKNVEFKSFDDVSLPISVRWPSYNPRSLEMSNVDGKMNIDLVLRFAVEMTTFRIGEIAIYKLFKTESLQEYYVIVFWLIKIRFFELETPLEYERNLLSVLRSLHVKLIEDIELLAKYPYEKDTISKYLPVALSNAVYYTFYYFFPASQYIFTKAFHQTIYMQIVKLLYGTELVPSSVKLLWLEVFPPESRYHDVIKPKNIPLHDEEIFNNSQNSLNQGNNHEDPSIPIALAYAKYTKHKADLQHATQPQDDLFNSQLSINNGPETEETITKEKDEDNPETNINRKSMRGMIAGYEDFNDNVPTSESVTQPQKQVEDNAMPNEITTASTSPATMNSIAKKSALNTKPSKSILKSDENFRMSRSAGQLEPLTVTSKGLSMTSSSPGLLLTNKPIDLVALTYLEPPVSFDKTRKPLQHQGRAFFDSKQMSPLLEKHFAGKELEKIDVNTHLQKNMTNGDENATIQYDNEDEEEVDDYSGTTPQKRIHDEEVEIGKYKPRPLFIAKTVPVDWCVVGGEATFRPHIYEVPFETYDELNQRIGFSKKQFEDARKQTLIEKRKALRHLEKVFNYNQQQRYKKLMREQAEAESKCAATNALDKKKAKSVKGPGSIVSPQNSTTLGHTLDSSVSISSYEDSKSSIAGSSILQSNSVKLPSILRAKSNSTMSRKSSSGSTVHPNHSTSASIDLSASQSGALSSEIEDDNPLALSGAELMKNEKALVSFLKAMTVKDEIENNCDEQDF